MKFVVPYTTNVRRQLRTSIDVYNIIGVLVGGVGLDRNPALDADASCSLTKWERILQSASND